MPVAAPTIVTNAVTTGTATTLGVATPGTMNEGDLAFLFGNIGAALVLSPPAGGTWTQARLTVAGSSNMQLGIWWKNLATADLGATLSLSTTAARQMVVAGAFFPQCERDTQQDNPDTDLQTNIAVPAITPATDSVYELAVVSAVATVANSARSFTPPSSPWVELADIWTTNTTNVRIGIGLFGRQITGGAKTSQAAATVVASAQVREIETTLLIRNSFGGWGVSL